MAETQERTPLLHVEHLTKEFPVEQGVFASRFNKKKVHAVNDVSFDIYPGETFGLVGESGCGKSTTGRCIMRLTQPTSGRVVFDGKDVASMGRRELKEMRRNMQYIFQDPYASLNPRMTIGEIVSEPLLIHGLMESADERMDYVRQLLDVVGLNPEHINRYPHEFSGGQRQRIGIARAIVLEPEVVVCDEPVSALDVSVQAKVINLLERLQDDLGLSYVFISHDLSVVKHISDTVMVMYLGHEMELAEKDALFERPLHPYTQALLDVIPRIRHERIQDKRILQGDVPSPTNPPEGCVFHTRCSRCMRVCTEVAPELREVEPGHLCACHLFDEALSEAERELVGIAPEAKTQA